MMATRALTRRPRTIEARHNREDARNAPPPDPNAFITMLCHRCTRPFKAQGIFRHCVPCITGAAAYGIAGSETIGEAGAA